MFRIQFPWTLVRRRFSYKEKGRPVSGVRTCTGDFTGLEAFKRTFDRVNSLCGVMAVLVDLCLRGLRALFFSFLSFFPFFFKMVLRRCLENVRKC